MSGLTSTPGGEPCSKEMFELFAQKYDMKHELWAVCAKTDVFLSGILDECPCGLSAADWVAHWKAEIEIAAKDEKQQVENMQSKEIDKSEDFPKNAFDAFGNKRSVKDLFLDHLYPYYVDHPGEWDDTKFGAEWVDLVTSFIAKYEATAQKDRTKFLDRIRNKEKIEDKIKELVAALS
jgi:hypothetical protein